MKALSIALVFTIAGLSCILVSGQAISQTVTGNGNAVGDNNQIDNSIEIVQNYYQKIESNDDELRALEAQKIDLEEKLRIIGGESAEIANELSVLRERERQLLSENMKLKDTIATYQAILSEIESSGISNIFADPQDEAASTILFLMESEENLEISSEKFKRAVDDRVLDRTLNLMIDRTESMESEEKDYWRTIIVALDRGNKLRLFSILGMEFIKLKALEEKLFSQIRSLNEKHLTEFQSQRASLGVDLDSEENVVLAVKILLSSGDTKSRRDAIEILYSSHIKFPSSVEIVSILAESLMSDSENRVFDTIQLLNSTPLTNSNADLLSILSVALYNSGDQDQSYKMAMRSLALGGFSDNILGVLRKFAKEEGDEEIVISMLSSIHSNAEISEISVDFVLNFSAILSSNGKMADAKSVLDSFLEQDFSVINVDTPSGNADYAIEAMKTDNPKRVVSNHEMSNLLSALAWIYYKSGDYDDAARIFSDSAILTRTAVSSEVMGVLSEIESGAVLSESMLERLNNALVNINPRNSNLERDKGEIGLAIMIISTELGRTDVIPRLSPMAVDNTYGCSASYLSEKMNWKTRMLNLLEKAGPYVGCP